MSKTATISLSLNVSGDITAVNTGPISNQLTNSPATHLEVSINSGSTTINIPQLPSPAQYVILIPPSNSAVSKWLMASGDTTGLQISATLPSAFALSTAITSFIVRATGSEVVECWFV